MFRFFVADIYENRLLFPCCVDAALGISLMILVYRSDNLLLELKLNSDSFY